MHFLEALLEWRDISDNSLFEDLSDEIVTLFFNRFYCSTTGALAEFYAEDLTPLQGPKGTSTEPGHHFEWVYLLERYKNVTKRATPPFSPLYDFAHRYGVCRQEGLLWGEVSKTGQPIGSSVRLWPHTEWMKAEMARSDNSDLSLRLNNAWMGLSRFLDHPQSGLWHETFDHNNRVFIREPSPASSLYHIVLCIETLNECVTNSK